MLAMNMLIFWSTIALSLATEPTDVPLPANRTWDVLKEADLRDKLGSAATKLGDWEIDLAGVPIDGKTLAPLAAGSLPLTQQVREALGRPVDVEDLLYLLDDVLLAEDRRGERFHIHSGRARSHGILLHPDDIFKNRPRRYGRRSSLPVDVPEPQPPVDQPAEDGSPPSPEWTARYRNPEDRAQMLLSLAEERPESDFAARIEDLLVQLEAAGAEVYLASASRHPERGYLMWGAFVLAKADSKAAVDATIDKLDARNREWGLNIPISWSHPDGWEATVEGARRMADSYDVVYATERGARSSNHYGGTAVDLIAIDLPRRVTLTAPDGATRSFLLTDPDEARDLSLTPRMIEWLELHWGLSKLKSDYPHWNDR